MAASYTRRMSNDSLSTSFIAIASHPSHSNDKLIVIDWLSLSMTSAAGGVVTFTITDATDTGIGALAQVIFQTKITIAAGESDTIFLPFPGGFPLRNIIDTSTESGSDTLGGFPTVATSPSVTCDATTWELWIGYHLERPGNRG